MIEAIEAAEGGLACADDRGPRPRLLVERGHRCFGRRQAFVETDLALG
jgi:hypothetical protein